MVSGKGNVKLVQKKSKSVRVTGIKAGTAVIKAKAGKKVKKIKITVRPQFYNNYNKLKNYIIDNGIYDYEVDSYIVNGIYKDGAETYEYRFEYDAEIEYISMWLSTEYDDEADRDSMVVDIDLDGSADPMCFIELGDLGEIDMVCDISMNKITTENDLKWSVYENDSALTGRESSVQDYCNSFLDFSLAVWQDELWSLTGLTLYDLGFTSFV